MTHPARTALQALAILSLIVATAWMIIRPGFDSLLATLGSISAIITLTASSSSNTAAHMPGQSSDASTPTPSFSLTPPRPSIEKSTRDWTTILAWLLYGPFVLIGFLIGVQQGAIIGVAGAFGGFVVGIIVANIAMFLWYLGQFLWITKWFWVFIAALVAIGYFINYCC